MRHVLLFFHVLLQMIHQPRPVPFHLLVRRNSAKRNLAHVLPPERPIRNPSNNHVVLQTQHRVMSRIEHQSNDVLLRHVRKLFAKYILQSNQPYRVLLVPIVFNHLPLQLPVLLLLSQVHVSVRVVSDGLPAQRV